MWFYELELFIIKHGVGLTKFVCLQLDYSWVSSSDVLTLSALPIQLRETPLFVFAAEFVSVKEAKVGKNFVVARRAVF